MTKQIEHILVAEILDNTRKALDDGNLKEILEKTFDGEIYAIEENNKLIVIAMNHVMFITFDFFQKKKISNYTETINFAVKSTVKTL